MSIEICAWCDNPVGASLWFERPLVRMLQHVCVSCARDYDAYDMLVGH